MTGIAFEKWEGLANDFILVDAEPSLEVVKRLCDRRRGVGADGVLVVTRPDGTHLARMVVFNADGSRPEMCGNGLRCVAAYLVEPGSNADLVIATDAGDRACKVQRKSDEADVDVDMGIATFGPELRSNIDGSEIAFATANVGNPHAITFAPVDAAKHATIGRGVERAVDGGSNVEFARPKPGGFDVVVWERGVGFTQACGTGACAVAAVACRAGYARFGEAVRLTLPGGDLSIVVAAGATGDKTGAIRMSGPARRAFRGVWG